MVAGLMATGGAALAAPLDPSMVLQACGMTRVTLGPVGAASHLETIKAMDVVANRAGPDHALVTPDEKIELWFPVGTFDPVQLDAALVRGALSFQQVRATGLITDLTIADNAQVILPDADGTGYLLEAEAVIDNAMISDAQVIFDMDGAPVVAFRFTEAGSAAFGQYTTDHVGEAFAIVYDRRVLSAPIIQSPIYGGSGIITENFTATEAENLAMTLRSGALPVDLVVENIQEVAGTAPDSDLCQGQAAE